MPGSFTFAPQPVPLGRDSAAIVVFRFNKASSTYELLENIRCLGIQYKEGADPGSARFRYAFDDPLGDPEAPYRFEQVYPLDATGPGVVSNDDRLVVFRLSDDGSLEILFDGFAQIPQADLGPETETVSFVAVGTPVREWDTPLAGAIMRDADAPLTVSNIQTDLPARFNPEGKPNAGPADDTGDPSEPYCVFLGPVWPANEINTKPIRPWTVPRAARYLVGVGNPEQEWTTYANLTGLTEALVTWTPRRAGGPIDVGAPATYTTEEILVQDYDVTGETWPVALERLVAPHGFGMRFRLEPEEGEAADEGSPPPILPKWSLDLYRKDDQTRVKPLHLQEAGNLLDPGQSNVGEMSLARDANELANSIIIDCKPPLIEASFILAPGFDLNPADANNKAGWIGEDAPDNYRVWVFDECGEGHYSKSEVLFVKTPGDLKKLLTGGADNRQFVRRRRPGRATLVSLDAENRPKRAQLHVTGAYSGAVPGIWDGSSGTWQEVNSSEWHLLRDRLGFRITAEDPSRWKIGSPAKGEPNVFGGVLKLVDWMNAPTADRPMPIFRLTCVIEADRDFRVRAGSRSVSPTSFTITRRVDARDRFTRTTVSKYSALGKPANIGIKDVNQVNDEPEAQSYAAAVRRAREAAVFAGSVTIPRITTAYEVGDKIDEIDGRGVSLRSNVGDGAGESGVYPTVVALSWDFDGKQTTTLELSDRRAEPPPKTREAKDD
jgi:hypothetical protein